MPVCMVQRNEGVVTRISLVEAAAGGPGRVFGESSGAGKGKGKGLRVVPLRPVGDVVAAAIVPGALAESAALNGVPLAEGLHLLRHADRLTMSGQQYWIAVQPTVEEVDFSPDIHGEDAFCFLTKARLGTGDRIVVCPGKPGVPCGAIYKADAWELAMRPESGLKCLRCGFHPSQTQWEPPKARERIQLDALYQLASQRES
ncbi:MAG: hypothetical protein HUU20_14780 [Pirellulales bacterium]|nr:hypothetical protein [Pirellulales bacterium]